MTLLENTMQEIEKDIQNHRIILYMKGTKDMPLCGFSARVVDLLNDCHAEFVTRNILDSPELRQAIKEYSDWPTLPQLYIDQEFVGGCDIVVELYNSGELQKLINNEN